MAYFFYSLYDEFNLLTFSSAATNQCVKERERDSSQTRRCANQKKKQQNRIFVYSLMYNLIDVCWRHRLLEAVPTVLCEFTWFLTLRQFERERSIPKL